MTDKFKPAATSDTSRYLDAVFTDKNFLTLEEEVECGKTKDQAAIDRLVTSHLALAASLARKFAHYGAGFEDLLQESNLALMVAARKFDPERGRFSTIATVYINSALYEYTTRSTVVRAAISKPRRKLFFSLKKMKDQILSSTGRKSLNTADIKMIADQLDVCEFDVREMDVFVSNHDMSLDTAVVDQSSLSHIDFLSDSSYEPSSILENRQQAFINEHGVADAIDELDDREKMIITNRYGLNESEEEMTLQDLSIIFGVSVERVRQIEVKALQKIHNYVKMFDVDGKSEQKKDKPRERYRNATPEQIAARREYDRLRNRAKRAALKQQKEIA